MPGVEHHTTTMQAVESNNFKLIGLNLVLVESAVIYQPLPFSEELRNSCQAEMM